MKVYEVLTLYNNKKRIEVEFYNASKNILPMKEVSYKLEDVPFELLEYEVTDFGYYKNLKKITIYI